MRHKITALIHEYGMIERDDCVYVALSGGADSVALLHVLLAARDELGCTVRALHLNHQLRGAESKRDEHFVRRLCADWGVPLTVESLPVAKLAKAHGLSVETGARRVRYAFFRRHATAEHAKVATAHSLSDNAETILLNLARGTGLRGLCGIPPVRGNVIRPLLSCSRREVEAYCLRHDLDYVTDSSNLTDEYARNRLRHQVVPQLEALNPRFQLLLGRMARILRADAELLDAMAVRSLSDITQAPGIYGRAAFLALPEPLWPRVLRALLRAGGVRYDSARLALLARTVADGHGAVQLTRSLVLACDNERFTVAPPAPKRHRFPPVPATSVPMRLPDPGQAAESDAIAGKKLRMISIIGRKYKKVLNNQQNPLKNSVNYDRIEGLLVDGPLLVRHARPGDRLRPVGRGCTKTLKNLWSEAGMDPGARRGQLLLECAGRVLWAEGFGPDEAAAPDEDTEHFLMIEIRED